MLLFMFGYLFGALVVGVLGYVMENHG